MNVLRIIPSMDPITGGPCQGIRNAIPYLEKLQVHNEVVCFDSPTATFLNQDPFLTHALGPRKSPWGYSAKLVPWLLDNLGRFDVVIVHGLWLYHSYATLKALKQLKKKHSNAPKLCVMPHGMLDPWFQKAERRKLKAIRNWVYWKLIEKQVVNEADGILFTCEEELRLARVPFRPYAPKREINVGYGVQSPPAWFLAMEHAFYTQCPQVQDSSYWLFLSRIHEKKGVDLLITAYLRLKNKGLNLPKLVIAGPGLETTYGKKILQLANNNPNIHFVGMLQGDAKWGAFYGCEAFILPSHQENFGIAVVEAMACKKPVLISNQVNIWKEIEAGQAGIISPDTLEGVQAQLEKWISLSESEKKKMGQNAYETYRANFSVEGAAQKMVQVFNQY